MIPTIYLSLWFSMWRLILMSLHFSAALSSGHLCKTLASESPLSRALKVPLPLSPLTFPTVALLLVPASTYLRVQDAIFKSVSQVWLILADHMLLCWSILSRNLGNLWTARGSPFDLWFISGSVLLKSTGALCSFSHSEGHPSRTSLYYFAQEHLPGAHSCVLNNPSVESN